MCKFIRILRFYWEKIYDSVAWNCIIFGKYDSVSGGVDANAKNPYAGDGIVKASVMIGDMKKSFEYSYTKYNPIGFGYVGVGGSGQSGVRLR